MWCMGKELGFEVEDVEPFRVNGHVVSSTLLRRLLHMGRLEEAAFLLQTLKIQKTSA